MEYAIRLDNHPNNETRLTLYPLRKKVKSVVDKCAEFLGVSPSELVPRGERSKSSEAETSLLDIRSEFRTKCQAHSYKRTKFGLFAKRRIMRAGGAMDKNDPVPSNYLFMTATLPGDDDWSKWAIAEESHHMIDGLKSWISKLQGDRLEFYVWEHQGRGALHLHYAIHMPLKIHRDRLKAGFRGQWIRLLNAVTKRTGIDMWGKHSTKSVEEKHALIQTNVQEVHTSVAAYMAGYCGGTKDKHEYDHVKDNYPKRWYGISRPLSALIKKWTKTETVEYSNYRDAKLSLMNLQEHFDYGSLTPRKYPHKFGYGETSVYYHSPKTSKELWLSRKKMKYSSREFPILSFFMMELASLQRTHLDMETSSQLYRGLCSKLSVEALRDTCYLDSLRRGSLNIATLESLETLYLCLTSQSSLPPTLHQLSKRLERFALQHSQVRPQLKWNRHGWLAITDDLARTVDKKPIKSEYRTTCDEGDTPSAPDSHRGQVPGGPKAEIFQLSIL